MIFGFPEADQTPGRFRSASSVDTKQFMPLASRPAPPIVSSVLRVGEFVHRLIIPEFPPEINPPGEFFSWSLGNPPMLALMALAKKIASVL